MNSATKELLTIRGLAIEFRTDQGTVQAVRNVSLDIPPGHMTGLVGESGSGKSVTALAVLRLLHPRAAITSGEIRLNGQDLLKLAEREVRAVRGRQIAMVPQDPLTALNPGLRIGAQLKAALRSHSKLGHKATEAQTQRLLKQVRLHEVDDVLRRYPHELSGGQRQRVVIALALTGRPKILLADEATTALDVTTQDQIMNLLRELNKETGMGVVVISHNLGLIARNCEYGYVMRAGEVVEHGTVETLFTKPRHTYTRQLLGSLPDPKMRGRPLGFVEPPLAGAPVD